MKMPRKTEDIIAELRLIKKTMDATFHQIPVTTQDAAKGVMATLSDAADRLENATMASAFTFAAPHTFNADLKWKVGFRAGVEAFRDAIADGSIDEMVKK